MTWWKATSVTVTAGQSTVTVNTGDDVSIIKGAEGLVIGNQPPVEIKRSYLNGSVKMLELTAPWPYANQSGQPAIAFPTDGDLAEATRILRSVGNDAVTFAEKLSVILTSITPTVPIETEAAGTINVVPYAYLVNSFNTLLSGFGDFGQPLYQTDSKNEARTMLGLAPQLTAQATLKMDFVNNAHFAYEPFGLTRKILTEVLASTRASIATYNSQQALVIATVNTPRITCKPATGECMGLLCEGADTNLLTYSSDFDNAVWTKTNSLVTANALLAPDLSMSADLLNGSTAVTTSGRDVRVNTAANPAAAHTFSIFVKRASCNFVALTMRAAEDASNSVTCEFNLLLGTVSIPAINNGVAVGATASIEPYLDGWFRLRISGTCAQAGAAISTIVTGRTASNSNAVSENTQMIYIWGAQLNSGSTLNSYIATGAAQVSRSFSAERVNPAVSETEGTIFVEFVMPVYADFNVVFGSGVGSTEEFRINTNNNGTVSVVLRAGSTNSAVNLSNPSSVGAKVKVAFRYKKNSTGFEIKSAKDGVISGTIVTAERLPTSFTTSGFSLGSRRTNSQTLPLNSTISNFAYYARALSDAELIYLTRL